MDKYYKSTDSKKEKSHMIYGIRSVIETIDSGMDLEKVFIQSGLKGELLKQLTTKLHKNNTPMSRVPIEKINRFTRKNHQGVVAFVSPVKYHNVEHLVQGIFEHGDIPFIVVLDRVTDVRNFGAIARSAEGLGAQAMIIPTQEASQINPDSIKTSAGALNVIPICRSTNLKETIQYLKDSGISVVAVTEKAAQNISEVELINPTALILGSEENGISPAYLKMADHLVTIPMSGKIASLNVSAAAAMALYEVVRQRG